MSYKGIDISQHNGNIDFDKLKNEVDFAILRLGWIGNRDNHTLDTKFWEYYHECKRVGIPVGIYVFCYAQSVEAAKSGANWVLQNIQKGDIELPIYIDMENDDSSSFKLSSLGKRKLTDIAKSFNEVIESSGQWAGVYANLDWWKNYLIKSELSPRFTSWVAHYGVDENKYNGKYDMLQYTSSGKVKGIKSNVDLNIMYRDLINEIKNNTPAPQPQPTPQPTPALKYKVGDRVNVSSYYASSTDPLSKAVIKNATGTITKVLTNGCHNPYLLDNGNIGWCNDGDIRGYANDNECYPACEQRYNSLVDALKSIGVDTSFSNRKRIANKNGINNYIGSSMQNIRLLTKLKAGRLLKV